MMSSARRSTMVVKPYIRHTKFKNILFKGIEPWPTAGPHRFIAWHCIISSPEPKAHR